MIVLLAVGCSSAPPAFTIGYRNGRSFETYPLAVGAKTSFALTSPHWEGNGANGHHPIQADAMEVRISDRTALNIRGERTLVGNAPGVGTLTVTGTIQGQRSSVSEEVEVAAIAERVWHVDGAPLTEDLTTFVGQDVGLSVHLRDAEGRQLITDGVEVPLPEHATLKARSGMPEFLVVQFKAPAAGTFDIPDGPSIHVVDTWDEANTEGAQVTLLASGIAPYVRAPGPPTQSMTPGCEVKSRATGTNPFTVVPRAGTSGPCKVQLTVRGRTLVVPLTF